MQTPPQARHLPIDPHRGIPVPWFVAWVGGGPEWRIADKLPTAVRFGLCWLCGQQLPTPATFVIGPMCVVNRVTAEPPNHPECARWAVLVCPFLTRPHARRRESNMPAGWQEPAGIMLRRNPGVAVEWTTTRWSRFKAGDGKLFSVGDPTSVRWWHQGREATREQAAAAVEAGLPQLRREAAVDGPEALALLRDQTVDAMRLLPAPAGGNAERR